MKSKLADRQRSKALAGGGEIALASAGATVGTGGAPTPPGGKEGSPPTRWVRMTSGAWDMRSVGDAHMGAGSVLSRKAAALATRRATISGSEARCDDAANLKETR
jgi:hypothetical protein